ncbi:MULTISPECIES: hypothetical protein [Pseudomonas]|uniref:hypothetical protein n=1 Tax=Pseudomonas TaxID=286 RepID=UPI0003C38CD7|nr:hypothetical protein [Pseudomonas aeruginosa]ESR70853.1 hypothetical protein T266_12780 [Pseudomonas aeruginosa VRFPA05]AUA70359.1 hypothetical protein CWI25_10140 [Pseudomonas aeruginosa]AUA94921.1 hypothetical protein CWI24_10325 [Pseudomonas aeruginosa]EJV1364915.1 hypothetical protein [Pseudomonas aeruginosa]EJV1383880.1 hypothetical protein [Pseudomonas aeruginosa]
METGTGALITVIDMATEGTRALRQIEDLVLRANNIRGASEEVLVLCREVVQISVDTRAFFAAERQEAEKHLNEIGPQ